jgi:hypothetical protein
MLRKYFGRVVTEALSFSKFRVVFLSPSARTAVRYSMTTTASSTKVCISLRPVRFPQFKIKHNRCDTFKKMLSFPCAEIIKRNAMKTYGAVEL